MGKIQEIYLKKIEELGEIIKKKPRRFLSIDFGFAFIKIAHVEHSGQVLNFLNYDLKRIQSNNDNRVEILNFINGFLKSNSITEKDVFLTISDPESIVIKYLILPAVPKEEILETIKWQLKEEIPFDLENTGLDWQIAEDCIDEEGAKKNKIICILAKKEIINRYLSIVRECNLVPKRVSSGSFNYAHILRCIPEKAAISAVLDIGYKDASLCIYKNNKLIFVRNLSFSSNKLTHFLMDTLMSDKGAIELSYEKAERIKQAFGIPEDESVILDENIQAIYVISLMRPFLEGLITELKRSFEYFTSGLKEEWPSAVYITGGGANLKNLDRYMKKELGINVFKLPLPECINTQALDKEKLNNDQNQLLAALGAALADVHSINLLPEEIKAQKLEFVEKVSLRIVSITLGVIFLFSLFIFKLQMADYKKRLRTAGAHLDAIGDISVLKQKVDSRQDLLNLIQRNEVPTEGILKLISAIVPNNIVLSEFELDQARHILILKGIVSPGLDTVETTLTNFMKKIEESSFFTEATLVASKKRDGLQEFELKCDLAG